MAKQKIIKVGNSMAITLPVSLVREGGWKIGDELIIEHSPTYQLMVIKPKHLSELNIAECVLNTGRTGDNT